MALKFGMGLESEYVDLWVDGQYRGNYLMTPKNDYDAPKEGYMLELDNYTDPDIEYQTEVRWWMAEGHHSDATLEEEIQAMYDAGFRGVELCQLNEGSIPMRELLTEIPKYCPNATITLELMDAKPSVHWLMEE